MKVSGREKLLNLVEYFSAEDLLREIVVGMSESEASEMVDHIKRMNDIDQTEEEN